MTLKLFKLGQIWTHDLAIAERPQTRVEKKVFVHLFVSSNFSFGSVKDAGFPDWLFPDWSFVDWSFPDWSFPESKFPDSKFLVVSKFPDSKFLVVSKFPDSKFSVWWFPDSGWTKITSRGGSRLSCRLIFLKCRCHKKINFNPKNNWRNPGWKILHYIIIRVNYMSSSEFCWPFYVGANFRGKAFLRK